MGASWEKIWIVLRREYQYNFKRPSFLFTAFGVPLVTVVLMFFIFTFIADRENNLDPFQRVGYIDRAGVVSGQAEIPERYVAVSSPDLAAPDASAGEEAAAAYYTALTAYANQQLIDGALDAYLVIPPDYMLSGRVNLYTQQNTPEALLEDIEEFLRQQIAAQAPANLPVPAERLGEPANLIIRDRESGGELSDAALMGRLLLPFVFVLIYFMATSTTAQFLMSGVVEEKENRLMEILVTSVRPLELLWGKLLGLGGLSLTQLALWTGGAAFVAGFNEDAQAFVSGARFQAGDVALLVVLFVINFVLFSAVMLAVGAAVTAEAESRQFAGLFTFITVLPMALLVTFFENPDGPLPLFFTFFPLTAAMALILRLGLTHVPLWQTALSVAIQIGSVIAVMWLAAKVFRLGMLMYGKPLTPRALWMALREGRTMLTTATVPEALGAPVKTRKRSLFRR